MATNSIGMFADFIDEKDVELIGVEAAGLGIEKKWYNDCVRVGSGELIWAINSAGQSATFTRLKSGVQIPHRPPPLPSVARLLCCGLSIEK